MCGIAGFFGLRPVSLDVPIQILRTLTPRGPDYQNMKCWDINFAESTSFVSNAMIATRLSVRDLSEHAHQPMSNSDRSIWIVYNGEIFGWENNANIMRVGGISFNTTSDTEYILNLYERQGIEFIKNLRGMFALGILDLRLGKLFLARDSFGIKPMVYSQSANGMAFGSTVRSVLHALPEDNRTISSKGIDAYLTHRYIPCPQTIFEEIKRLNPGTYLEYSLSSKVTHLTPYSPNFDTSNNCIKEIQQSIDRQLISDRPVGIFLSSGIDSSIIANQVAAIGRHDVKTYTASFPGSRMDEGPDAADFASSVNLRNKQIAIQFNIENEFSKIVADLDEPFADPSSIPLWYLAREAVKQVSVVLCGDGGDELFAGYKRYVQHARGAWRGVASIPFIGRQSSVHRRGIKKTLCELSMSWTDAYSLRFSGFTPAQRRFLQPNLDHFPAHYWRMESIDNRTPLRTMLSIDFENYLPEYILRKSDLCSMAHGLEIRVPFLDVGVKKAVDRMSDNQRFTRPPKLALKEALLNGENIFSRPKRGFNPPLKRWLDEDLSARLDVLGKTLSDVTNNQIQEDRITKLISVYRAGDDSLAEQMLQLLILSESLNQLVAIPQPVHF